MTPSRSRPARPPARTAVILVAALAAAAALFLVGQHLTPSHDFVSRLTIVNPTPYHLEMEARGVERAHGVTLGAIGREQTKEIRDVVDQGREWIFHFNSGPGDGGEVRVPREQLVSDSWTLTVPAAVADRLAAAGIPPSARE